MAISWEVLSLQLTAAKCRQNVLRMIKASGHGHLGGAFSSMEIVTALYFHTMNAHPADPKMPDRDRFLLSAGHKSMVQYAVLAERGFFEKSILDTYGSLHCKLPGHPDMHKLPGVEANTGALGHGLSIACGMAMGLKQDKKKSRVFVVLGDGELPEGSNWEGASVASHFKLDNLVAFVDYNGLQISGKVEDIMNMSPIDERFKAFGWAVKTVDGNDMAQVVDALDSVPLEEGKPSVIIARTVKSKGLSFAENDPAYHFWSPSAADLEKAEAEVAAAIEELETQLKGRIKA